ncbi:MAG: hypothetical protein AAF253_09860 [Pseudomonadota bacterium]
MAGDTKRVRLVRRRGWYGIARALAIEVDGEPMGAVRQNGRLDMVVPADARWLVGRMDWGQTERFDLTGVSDGQVIDVRAPFTLNSSRQLGLVAPIPFRFAVAGDGFAGR